MPMIARRRTRRRRRPSHRYFLALRLKDNGPACFIDKLLVPSSDHAAYWLYLPRLKHPLYLRISRRGDQFVITARVRRWSTNCSTFKGSLQQPWSGWRDFDHVTHRLPFDLTCRVRVVSAIPTLFHRSG